MPRPSGKQNTVAAKQMLEIRGRKFKMECCRDGIHLHEHYSHDKLRVVPFHRIVRLAEEITRPYEDPTAIELDETAFDIAHIAWMLNNKEKFTNGELEAAAAQLRKVLRILKEKEQNL